MALNTAFLSKCLRVVRVSSSYSVAGPLIGQSPTRNWPSPVKPALNPVPSLQTTHVRYFSQTVKQRQPWSKLQVKEIMTTNGIRSMSSHALKGACANSKDKSLDVVLKDGSVFKYPYAWLRDNCQCSKCFLPSSKARLFLLKDLDPDVSPEDMQVLDDNSLRVTWPGGHESVFTREWLMERKFTAEVHQKRRHFLERPAHTWGSEMHDRVPKFIYKDLLSDENCLLDFLLVLETQGLAIVQQTPCESGQVEQFADKIAYLKTTNYGRTFTVKNKVDASNLAFTANALGLHTDLPYYNYMPGMQMLHCIKQAGEGGENMFSDAFHAVKQLKRDHPEYYDILSTQPIDFYDVGREDKDFHLLTMVPVIQLNYDGQPFKINYNNQVRDSFLNLPFEKVHLFYKALCKLEQLLNHPKNTIQLKLQAGEVVFFHNYRVMHGRRAYKMESGTERHLEGGYIDWDELRSARRVLEGKLGREA